MTAVVPGLLLAVVVVAAAVLLAAIGWLVRDHRPATPKPAAAPKPAPKVRPGEQVVLQVEPCGCIRYFQQVSVDRCDPHKQRRERRQWERAMHQEMGNP